MNCQDFESTIVELARDQLTDQREAETALAHTRSCSACAVRLADERTLSAGLRRFAETSRTERAPLRVEAAVSAAFRQRLMHQTGSAAVLPAARRWHRWAVAAAAAVLVLLALVAWRSVRTPGSAPQQVQVPSPRPEERPDRSVNPEQPRKADPRQSPLDNTRVKPAPRRRTTETKRYVAQSKQSNRPDKPEREVEIATEFMPLTGTNLIPLDGGHVVRVQLPRSALMAFGLPMNMERADERINADVLVGDDGLARAIRFVR